MTLSRAANGETKSRFRLETSKSINFHRPNLLREVSCMYAEASLSEFYKPIVALTIRESLKNRKLHTCDNNGCGVIIPTIEIRLRRCGVVVDD